MLSLFFQKVVKAGAGNPMTTLFRILEKVCGGVFATDATKNKDDVC